MTGLELLAAGIRSLRVQGHSDPEIRAAVDEALALPAEVVDTPAPGPELVEAARDHLAPFPETETPPTLPSADGETHAEAPPR